MVFCWPCIDSLAAFHFVRGKLRWHFQMCHSTRASITFQKLLHETGRRERRARACSSPGLPPRFLYGLKRHLGQHLHTFTSAYENQINWLTSPANGSIHCLVECYTLLRALRSTIIFKKQQIKKKKKKTQSYLVAIPTAQVLGKRGLMKPAGVHHHPP